MTLPQVGATGLVRTDGEFGKLIRKATRSYWNHSFIYVGDGWIVEARPYGSQASRLADSNYSDVAWVIVDTLDPDWPGEKIAEEALKLTGIPYGWVDIVSVGLLQYHLRPPGLKAIVANEHRLICSQLCDLANMRAGYQLFNDDRWVGDVTPGDLARRGGLIPPTTNKNGDPVRETPRGKV